MEIQSTPPTPFAPYALSNPGPIPGTQIALLPVAPARLVQDVPAEATTEHSAPTPASVDNGTETQLGAEIKKLWGEQKDGKDSVRRTRAELKLLRQRLGEKLHAMKAILVGTGREGRWTPYLRGQKLPLASANRYVAEHQARISPPAEKLLIEQHVGQTVDDARKLAVKLLPMLSRTLINQELVYEFVHELLWSMEVADVTDTAKGMEIPRT